MPFIGGIVTEIQTRYPMLEPVRRVHEVVRRVITRMIEDVIVESGQRLRTLAPRDAAAVRHAAGPVVMFSPAMNDVDAGIKGFLYPRMYRHARVMRVMGDAEDVIRDLFAHFVASPTDMPEEWSDGVAALDQGARARRIADYIAGMTDRYALVEHARHFARTPELR